MKVLNSEGLTMEKVLLHTCCGPCFLYPHNNLKDNGFNVTSFFYNPNIQPYQEYEKRRNCLKDHAEENEITLIEGNYDIDRFFQDVVFREKVRCSVCYKLRLKQTVKVAKQSKFDYFTTTLLVSPYQKHDTVREIGETLAEKHNIPFLYINFQEGWKETVEKSKKLGFYRQRYCGCVYSERERHQPKRRDVN